MDKAKKAERWEDYDKLQMQRDSLSAGAAGFKKDAQSLFSDPRYHTQTASGGVSGIKMDKEQAAIFEGLTDSIKKLTAKYDEQIGRNELKEAGETLGQLQQKYKEYNKEVAAATAPTGMQVAQNAVKAVGIGQIANAINDGFARWISTLDRSGIVNQYGSGDILGGRIAEERRQADLWGGAAQSGLGIAGTAFGATPWGLATGGPLVWGTVGAGLGKLTDSLLHIEPNKDATEAAYAGLWQNRSGEAMELAAVMGSANDVREAFKTAADSAAKFGYSAEEGMDALKQTAQQGLSGGDAVAVTERAFDFERRTGADRGTLLGISSMSARYGAGDALGAGWAGLQASGMKAGQYNEYLRAMQRVMEDGISKGFVRSSDQVVSSLTMLAQMTGKNPLWQGENGARRLMEMNAGLEGATGLASASDILAFRGAQNVLENDRDGKLWNSIANVDGKEGADIKRSGSYIDAMILMERGLNSDTFGEIMKLNSHAEGGDRSAVIERMRQQFSLNYTNSAMLYDQWDRQTEHGTREMPKENAQALVNAYGKEPPSANSPELEAAKKIEEIKNILTATGQEYWDKQMKELPGEFAKAMQEYNAAKTVAGTPTKTNAGIVSNAAEQLKYQVLDGIKIGTVSRKTDQMFDQTFGSKADREAYRTVNSIFSTALTSNDAGEREMAGVFYDTIGALTNKQGIKEFNSNDTWNRLGEANDIRSMIRILTEILEETRKNGNVNFLVEG
jgi:hypothetical protein